MGGPRLLRILLRQLQPALPVGGERLAARAALAAARALHVEDARAAARMAANGRRLLGELLPGGGYQLLTHCNTGVLVSGGEGTAFGVALAAHRDGMLRRLWVDETRPLLQGARLTTWEAVRAGKRVNAGTGTPVSVRI